MSAREAASASGPAPPAFLPPPPFRRSLAVRLVLVWLAIRAGASGALVLSGNAATDALRAGLSSPFVIVMVLTALRFDVRRRGEDVLFANLGVSARRLAASGAGVCLALEALVALAVLAA